MGRGQRGQVSEERSMGTSQWGQRSLPMFVFTGAVLILDF